MTNLYFEELDIGTRSVAGPYSVSSDEIIQFANSMIRYHATSMKRLRRAQFLGG